VEPPRAEAINRPGAGSIGLSQLCMSFVSDLRHCSKLQNVMMYPVQLVDIFSDTFRPLIESAVNMSSELDEIVAGQAVKGYLQLLNIVTNLTISKCENHRKPSVDAFGDYAFPVAAAWTWNSLQPQL